MSAHVTAPMLTVRIRADIDHRVADDLVGSLQLAGWEGTGMLVPRTGAPEVTFPLTGARVTMRRLVKSLPCLLDAWRVRHGLDGYEVVVARGAEEAARTVMSGDRDGATTRALIAAIAEVIGADQQDRGASTA